MDLFNNRIVSLIVQIVIIIAAGGLIYLMFEAKWLKLERLSIKSPKLTKGQHLRIIHISDIHIDVLRQNTYTTKRMIESCKPDVILLTGDYINDKKRINTFLSWFLSIKPEKTPVYACLGNHDVHAFSELKKSGENQFLDGLLQDNGINPSSITSHEAQALLHKARLDYLNYDELNDFTNTLKKYGVNILRNESVGLNFVQSNNSNVKSNISVNSTSVNNTGKNTSGSSNADNESKFYISGIDESRYFLDNPDKALSSVPQAAFNIVLGHNPDLVFNLPSDKTDLFLCGHFHGGQIRLPLHLEYKVFRTEKLCTQGIYKGYHEVNGIKMYISRGLGCVLLPFRLLSRPEITVMDIGSDFD